MDKVTQERLVLSSQARGPQCDSTDVYTRGQESRKQKIFAERGREQIRKKDQLARQDSMKNTNAGIVVSEWVDDELKDFFPEELDHAKNQYRRLGTNETDEDFKSAGVPFISGASGTIQAMILLMEDTLSCKYPRGIVPCGPKLEKKSMLEKAKRVYTCNIPHVNPDRHAREALIGLMTAVLIAAGHHSLGECLVAAKALGYFTGVPSFIPKSKAKGSYAVAAAMFEKYLETLGLTGARGVLAEFARSRTLS